jgi:hypothetical protein
MREIIRLVGEDPNREGLRKTPERFEKALKFLTSGYHQNVEHVLNGATFSVNYDEMVVVKDIEFFSLCEHHLLPFFGKAHVAYLPTNKVIGFAFHLAGVPTGGIRVEFPTTDTTMTGSDSYAIAANADGDYTADLTTAAGDAHKLTPAFTATGFTEPAFAANHLLSVQFHVATNTTAAITVTNLCVSNFKAIVGP